METPELTAALARFDSLPPVEARRLRGEWRGSGVPTGHPLDGLLELYGWWGKRFDGPDDVHPLVFQDGRGRFSVPRPPAGRNRPNNSVAFETGFHPGRD